MSTIRNLRMPGRRRERVLFDVPELELCICSLRDGTQHQRHRDPRPPTAGPVTGGKSDAKPVRKLILGGPPRVGENLRFGVGRIRSVPEHNRPARPAAPYQPDPPGAGVLKPWPVYRAGRPISPGPPPR
ncbi:MAG: hypothetical protein QG597_4495 [Actinomycetota bacterium]|nr:hypothetical protein [Actinomycetota bacterium]